MSDAHDSSQCDFCQHDHPFDLPSSLVTDVTEGRVVVFAGAGVSTEMHGAYASTFYEDIRAQLPDGLPVEDESFPGVMELFCTERSRAELVQKFRSRVDYGDGYYEIRNSTARFHRELATIPYIDTIITTNWDSFFEEECGALPFVVPEDYAYWDLPGRRVFKIHGSISNIGTIVATRRDYEACYRRLKRGVIGATLQHLLATRTVVFVGYSLRDPDFVKLYQQLRRQLGDFIRRAYIVVPSEDPPALLEFPDSIHLRTSGVHFARELKSELVRRDAMLDDAVLDEVSELHDRVRQANLDMYEKFRPVDSPAVIYAAAYQNGAEHVFQRVATRSRFGEYMTEWDIRHRLHPYHHLQDEARSRRHYTEVAYLEGVSNALVSLLMSKRDRRRMPLYYIFGSDEDLTTERKFLNELKRAPRLHKTAYKQAERLTRDLGDMVVRHPPWL